MQNQSIIDNTGRWRENIATTEIIFIIFHIDLLLGNRGRLSKHDHKLKRNGNGRGWGREREREHSKEIASTEVIHRQNNCTGASSLKTLSNFSHKTRGRTHPNAQR